MCLFCVGIVRVISVNTNLHVWELCRPRLAMRAITQWLNFNPTYNSLSVFSESGSCCQSSQNFLLSISSVCFQGSYLAWAVTSSISLPGLVCHRMKLKTQHFTKHYFNKCRQKHTALFKGFKTQSLCQWFVLPSLPLVTLFWPYPCVWLGWKSTCGTHSVWTARDGHTTAAANWGSTADACCKGNAIFWILMCWKCRVFFQGFLL